MNRRSVMTGAGIAALGGLGAGYMGLRDLGSLDAYNAAVGAQRAILAAVPGIRDLVRYATLAPSGHNTQPWRFRLHPTGVVIIPDPLRRTPVVDPDDHHLFVGLGAAAENLSIAAGARGQGGEVAFDPSAAGGVFVRLGQRSDADTALFDAIPRRQSTRSDFDGQPVSMGDLKTLTVTARTPGVDLILITDRPQLNRVRDLVVTGNSAQLADPAFVRELTAWLRFSPRQAMERGDGLFTAASGLPVLPAWAGSALFDLTFKEKSENDKYARQIASSPGIAVFVSQHPDPAHWVQAGRACQRFALQATALGMKHAFINQPVEVARLRPELASLVGLPGRRPDLVMRFGYAAALPCSARRPAATLSGANSSA